MKVTEIFKPKTGKEIWNDLSNLSPDKMLIASASAGLLTGVQMALEKGADINAIDEYDGCSALAANSENGHLDIVCYLLDRKALVCNFALMGVFDKPEVFKPMLDQADVEYCCGLELALDMAEEAEREDLVTLIREKIRHCKSWKHRPLLAGHKFKIINYIISDTYSRLEVVI